MKREFLEGLKLEKDTIDAIMAENGKDIERENAKTEEEKTQKDLLDRQLKEATKTIKSYKDMDVDAIKTSAADWEEKAKDTYADLNNLMALVEDGDNEPQAFATTRKFNHFLRGAVDKNGLPIFNDARQGVTASALGLPVTYGSRKA